MIEKRSSPFRINEHLIIGVLLSFIIHATLWLFIPVRPIEKPKFSSNLSVKLQAPTNKISSNENSALPEKTDVSTLEKDFAELINRLQKIETKYAKEPSNTSHTSEKNQSINDQLKFASAQSDSPPNDHVNYYPIVLYRPHLRYPPIAYTQGIEGKVMIAANIMPNGSLTDITVKESSGHQILDYSAHKSVKQWRFIPPPNGMTVPVEIPVVFESCNMQTL